MADYVVAIDVGGTAIKTLLVTEAGVELGHRRTPTPRHAGPAAGSGDAVEAVLDETEKAVRWGRQLTGRSPAALAVASLGLVDQEAGIALHSAALGWRDVPLRSMLAARTGIPTVLDQDLRAAAAAEAALGHGRDEASFLFVAIGTGVGAALVRHGVVETGAGGLAGELGHIPVPPGRAGDRRPRQCGCGAAGCLETEASATALSAGYLARTGRTVAAAEVAELARLGDADAIVAWEDLIAALASGLVAAAALLDPGLVVLGGGVALAGGQLLQPLRERLAEGYRLAEPPRLVASALGDRGAGLGAALLGWRHLRAGDLAERIR